jgi:glycosyltransferase involved in cell wall biosynthesis
MTISLQHEALFLVWGPPSHGPRSQVLARELGIERLHFVYATTKRGLFYAPFKYMIQAVQTLALLFRQRPRLVFVQSPPGLAVLFVAIYCLLSGSHYVIDAHTAAFAPYWTHPRWLYHWLARRAITTLVTNEHLQAIVQNWGGRAFVLRDIPTAFAKIEGMSLDGNFNVLVVNSFGDDEPLRGVLEAARSLQEVQFYVSGKKKNADPELLANVPANVHFTDFLPNEQYYALMSACQAVVCLTTRDNTMQRGACEALWMGKPIITSDWPLLQDYFCKGTVHVQNNVESIRAGIVEMQAQYRQYAAGISELQQMRRQEWEEKTGLLLELIGQAFASRKQKR